MMEEHPIDPKILKEAEGYSAAVYLGFVAWVMVDVPLSVYMELLDD